MNQISVIQPYRHAGTWVFDDDRVGLEREPFVCGTPEIIDRLVADIHGAAEGFRLLFSADPFPGALPFDHLRDEAGGAWYADPRTGAEGWLCPALLLYFKAPPPQLHVKAEPLRDQATDR